MKILSLLIATLMLVGFTPCYSATNVKQRPGTSETRERKSELNSHERTSEPRKPQSKKSKKSKKSKFQRIDREEKHAKIEEQNDPLQGPKGDKGDKGDQGDKGDKGDSYPIAYGHFYTLSNDAVEQNESVMFTTPSVEAGGIALDTANGAVRIPESGNYLISFHVYVKGAGVSAFGVRVNHETIIPGSVFRGQTAQNRLTQISGSLIATFAAGDTFNIVNLSNNAFHFDNVGLADSPNACVTVRKLN